MRRFEVGRRKVFKSIFRCHFPCSKLYGSRAKLLLSQNLSCIHVRRGCRFIRFRSQSIFLAFVDVFVFFIFERSRGAMRKLETWKESQSRVICSHQRSVNPIRSFSVILIKINCRRRQAQRFEGGKYTIGRIQCKNFASSTHVHAQNPICSWKFIAKKT